MRTAGLGIVLLGAAATLASFLAAPALAAALRLTGPGTALVGALVLLGDGWRRNLAGAWRRELDRRVADALQTGHRRGLAEIARLQAGLPGRAKVLAVHDTGATFNARPELDLELEVAVDGRAPYRVRQRHLVPAAKAQALRQGDLLAVRVDPQVPERMLIAWDGD